MCALSIAVIGGGAAGMMAAATISEERPAAAVTLYERNPRLGAKVTISGGGRCNVTTGIADIPAVLERYPRGARWLRHAMFAFPPSAVMGWFEAHGVPLKTELDGRVFPVSDRGGDVVAAFERIFARRNVRVRTRSTVASVEWLPTGGFFVQSASGTATHDVVIITTGGAAFRHTGSQGDGYRFGAALGHTVTPLYPSLNAYVVREAWARGLSGLALPDALLRIPKEAGRRLAVAARGAMLFTHFGITGPAVFALCSRAATERYSDADPLPVAVRPLPDHSQAQIDALLQERFRALGGRGVANVLDTFLPRSLCTVLCELAGVDPATPAARVSRDERRRLVSLIDALPLSAIGRKNGEEFVTAGGIALAEVDARTMASRLVPGLFFAGEVLDVDGFTGGFNLQAAWATGRAAGLAQPSA